MTYQELQQHIQALSKADVEEVLRMIFGEAGAGDRDWDFACRSLAIAGDIQYEDSYWDDLRVPLTSTRVGALNKPEFDYTNIGYLFPQNDATEILYFVTQLPHQAKAGGVLRPHIHWQQTADTAVVWKFGYKILAPGGSIPAVFTTLTSTTPVFAFDTDPIHQVSPFPAIEGAQALSSVILGMLYREDDTTTGDVLAWDFDFHFEIDSPGSRDEYTK